MVLTNFFSVCLLSGFSNNGERRGKKSDFQVSEEDEKKKTRIGGLFKTKSSKFRHSLKKKGSGSRTRSIDRTLSLTFEDIHDAEELRFVSEFRQSLISDHLLPPSLDDYHMMLRSNFLSHFNNLIMVFMWNVEIMQYFHHMLTLHDAERQSFVFCRFLFARKFDLGKAKLMWTNMIQWRRDFGTDTILEVKT